jgi:hypothetical protein
MMSASMIGLQKTYRDFVGVRKGQNKVDGAAARGHVWMIAHRAQPK